METGRYQSYPQTLSGVRRDLLDVNDRIDSMDTRVDMMNQGLSPVPGRVGQVEEGLNMRGEKLAELEERNKLHSAKLKHLQTEMKYEKMKSGLMMDYLKTSGKGQAGFDQGYTGGAGQGQTGGMGYNDTMFQTNPGSTDLGTGNHLYADQTALGTGRVPTLQLSPRHDEPPAQRSPVPDNGYTGYDQRQPTADGGRAVSKQGVVQPASDYKTDNDNAKYNLSDNLKRDTGRSGGGGLNLEEMQRQRRKEIYSVFDSTAINPHWWDEDKTRSKHPFDHEAHPYPGGFLFLRFDDSAYDTVNVAIKKQQSICRNAGGYLMGIARKQRIFVFEHAQLSKQRNWQISRKQAYDDVITTENAIASFWFTRKEAAEGFFDNTHQNRFREPCFPTPNEYEAFYVPLQVSPTMTPYNTFLFIEILMTAQRRDSLQENLTQFEAEVRNDMSRVIPSCQPMIVSSSTGRVVFKPGTFVSPYSKLFISRFEAQRDVDKIWKLGMIQALRQKWGITGEINVFSMTIDQAF